jgi:hypothetical protein
MISPCLSTVLLMPIITPPGRPSLLLLLTARICLLTPTLSLNATFRILLTLLPIPFATSIAPFKRRTSLRARPRRPQPGASLATLASLRSPLVRSRSGARPHMTSASIPPLYTPGLVALPCLPAPVPVRLISCTSCTAPFNTTHPLCCAGNIAEPPTLPPSLCACVLADGALTPCALASL